MKSPTLLFIVFLLIVSCSSDGKKISSGYLDVYFTEGVTKTEATEVGYYLNSIGFGIDEEREKIQLSKLGDRYTCKFVMPDGKVSLENIWKRYGQSISKNVLNGAPVDVDLCDENFNSLKFLIAE